MRKLFFFCIAITITAIFWSPALSQEKQASPPIEFTILYFNDVHGHLLPFSLDAPGGKKSTGEAWPGWRDRWNSSDPKTKNLARRPFSSTEEIC